MEEKKRCLHEEMGEVRRKLSCIAGNGGGSPPLREGQSRRKYTEKGAGEESSPGQRDEIFGNLLN